MSLANNLASKPLWVRVAVRTVTLLLLLPAGLLCVGVPFYQLLMTDKHGLFDDTRALFGGGKAETDWRISSVDCVKQRAGSSSSRGIGITTWDCVLDFGPIADPKAAPAVTAPAPARKDEPYAGSYEQQMAEYDRRMADLNRRTAEQTEQLSHQFDGIRKGGVSLGRLERALPTNRSGELPALRRLAEASSDGGVARPPKFGVVWGAGDMVWRWLFWLLTSAILWAFGAGCLLPVWLAWRRKR